MKRALRIVLASATALAAGAAAVSTVLAEQRMGEAEFEAALRLNPLSAEARSAQSATLLAEERNQDAAQLAREAIVRSPLSPDSASILGYLAEREGDAQRAASLMSLAASLSWANESAQFWMLGQAADAGRMQEAVVRTDALLRQRIRREELFEFLRGLMLEPGAIEPLAAQLARAPRWRSDFLRRLADLPPEAFGAHLTLLKALGNTGMPPTREDAVAFARKLVSSGRYAEARSAWLELGQGEPGLIADPQFTNLRDGESAAPFEWAVWPSAGLSVRTLAGQGLQVRSDGRPSERAVEQLVVLPPGSYLFSVAARGSVDSMSWEISCASGGGSADALRRSPEETLVTIAGNCPAQKLYLRVDHDRPDDLDLVLRELQVRRVG